MSQIKFSEDTLRSLYGKKLPEEFYLLDRKKGYETLVRLEEERKALEKAMRKDPKLSEESKSKLIAALHDTSRPNNMHMLALSLSSAATPLVMNKVFPNIPESLNLPASVAGNALIYSLISKGTGLLPNFNQPMFTPAYPMRGR